jgi:SAM-dependent methyltransferase
VGRSARDESPYRRRLQGFKGRVARVVGVDIEPGVLVNPMLDDALVTAEGGPLPFPDATFDLVLADWVFEHLREPAPAIAEMARVLRPGGWVCARTTNRWGYVAIGARLIPRRLHQRVPHRLQPAREPESVFRGYYRLNTIRALKKAFPPSSFDLVVYPYDAEPAYAGEGRLGGAAASVVHRLVPPALATSLFLFARKR